MFDTCFHSQWIIQFGPTVHSLFPTVAIIFAYRIQQSKKKKMNLISILLSSIFIVIHLYDSLSYLLLSKCMRLLMCLFTSMPESYLDLRNLTFCLLTAALSKNSQRHCMPHCFSVVTPFCSNKNNKVLLEFIYLNHHCFPQNVLTMVLFIVK